MIFRLGFLLALCLVNVALMFALLLVTLDPFGWGEHLTLWIFETTVSERPE